MVRISSNRKYSFIQDTSTMELQKLINQQIKTYDLDYVEIVISYMNLKSNLKYTTDV